MQILTVDIGTGTQDILLYDARLELENSFKLVVPAPTMIVHRQILEDVLEFCEQEGFTVKGLIRSPLLGPKGNIEFLTWLGYPEIGSIDLGLLIDSLFSVNADNIEQVIE